MFTGVVWRFWWPECCRNHFFGSDALYLQYCTPFLHHYSHFLCYQTWTRYLPQV